jgi:hypothetical protein
VKLTFLKYFNILKLVNIYNPFDYRIFSSEITIKLAFSLFRKWRI